MIIKLIDLGHGEKGKIREIRGGRMVRRRLNDLGLTIGAIVTLKGAAPFAGPVRLLVKGSELVIGRGVANKIMVQYEKR